MDNLYCLKGSLIKELHSINDPQFLRMGIPRKPGGPDEIIAGSAAAKSQ
jgi:hypothetical protein